MANEQQISEATATSAADDFKTAFNEGEEMSPLVVAAQETYTRQADQLQAEGKAFADAFRDEAKGSA